MAYVPETNSVVAFQSDPTKLVGTVSVVGAISPSPASVLVLNPVSVLAVNPSPGSVLVVNPVSVLSVTQGTTPWNINVPSPSVIAYQLAGSVMAVSGTVSTTPQSSILLGSSNASVITFFPTTTTSVYAVLSSITTISIMAVNTSRRGGTIYNNAGTNVFVKLGTAATTSVFTVQLNPNDYYELPFNYTGVVAGITASNAGIINVTELQP